MIKLGGPSGLPGDIELLDCARGLWVDYDLMNVSREAGSVIEEATAKRFCRGYFKHEYGWSPEEHRGLVMRRKERLSVRVGNAFFAFLGVLLALLTQWVANLLGLA